MEKRGLSTVVATLLIILLVIVAVGVVWTVVRNVIDRGTGSISTDQFTIDLGITSASLSGNIVTVNVRRGAGEGDLSGFKLIFSDGTNSESVEENVALGELESQSFQVDINNLGVPNADRVSIAPIVVDASGNDVLGDIVDTETFTNGGTEEGGSVPPGASCGNGAIDAGEVCDGSALNSETCVTQGFDSGSLACLPDCSGYDTSLCTGGTCVDGETELCSLQQGVCALSEQTCTASAWPGCVYTGIVGYELAETTCDDGLDNDCDGLVDYADSDCELTWSGTVSAVWPGETNLYLEISEQTDSFLTTRHSGEYINFDTGNETRCIQIQDYVLPQDAQTYNHAIARLDEALVPYSVSIGDTFTIWDTSTTCS